MRERKNATSCSALLSVISQFCQCFGDLQVARCALFALWWPWLVHLSGSCQSGGRCHLSRRVPRATRRPPAAIRHPRCTNKTLRNRLPKLNRTRWLQLSPQCPLPPIRVAFPPASCLVGVATAKAMAMAKAKAMAMAMASQHTNWISLTVPAHVCTFVQRIPPYLPPSCNRGCHTTNAAAVGNCTAWANSYSCLCFSCHLWHRHRHRHGSPICFLNCGVLRFIFNFHAIFSSSCYSYFGFYATYLTAPRAATFIWHPANFYCKPKLQTYSFDF